MLPMFLSLFRAHLAMHEVLMQPIEAVQAVTPLLSQRGQLDAHIRADRTPELLLVERQRFETIAHRPKPDVNLPAQRGLPTVIHRKGAVLPRPPPGSNAEWYTQTEALEGANQAP